MFSSRWYPAKCHCKWVQHNCWNSTVAKPFPFGQRIISALEFAYMLTIHVCDQIQFNLKKFYWVGVNSLYPDHFLSQIHFYGSTWDYLGFTHLQPEMSRRPSPQAFPPLPPRAPYPGRGHQSLMAGVSLGILNPIHTALSRQESSADTPPRHLC